MTLELARTVQDLDILADRLVHIFLAENVAVDWLIYLADEEITAQFSQMKSQASSSDEPAELQSEDAEAYQQQTLKQEATRTLFRGNTLLTKSLMKFMEKVGKDYLEDTLGPYLRYIVTNSALESCEVNALLYLANSRLIRHISSPVRTLMTIGTDYSITFAKFGTESLSLHHSVLQNSK